MVGQSVSNAGNGAYAVALPLALLAHGSAFDLGFIVGFTTFAQMLTTLVAGALVDRMSPKWVVILNDAGGAIVCLALALLSLSDRLRVEHLYAATILFDIGFVFLAPAVTTLTAELVAPDVLLRGNAIRAGGVNVARVIGPLVGGLLVAYSPSAAFAFNGLTFSASAIAMLVAPASRFRSRGADSGLFASMRAGVAFVASTRWVLAASFGLALSNLGRTMGLYVGLPLLVAGRYGGSALLYGSLIATVAFGEAMGAVVAARMRRASLTLTFSSSTLGALGLVALAFPVSATAAAALCLVNGASGSLAAVLWETVLQQRIPRALLGRVVSADYLVVSAVLVPGLPLAGALAGATGPAGVFGLGGVVMLSSSIVGALRSRRAEDSAAC